MSARKVNVLLSLMAIVLTMLGFSVTAVWPSYVARARYARGTVVQLREDYHYQSGRSVYRAVVKNTDGVPKINDPGSRYHYGDFCSFSKARFRVVGWRGFFSSAALLQCADTAGDCPVGLLTIMSAAELIRLDVGLQEEEQRKAERRHQEAEQERAHRARQRVREEKRWINRQLSQESPSPEGTTAPSRDAVKLAAMRAQ